MASPQACDAVRSTCKDYTETSVCRNYVTIDTTAVSVFANEMRQLTETTGLVQWDEENWHYKCPPQWPAAIRSERMALYILAVDAINFCFWPVPSYEYIHLSTTLTRMAQADHDKQQETIDASGNDATTGMTLVHPAYALSASNLESMSPDMMQALFEQHAVADGQVPAVPPDLEQRCRLWNEVGRVIQTNFDGSAMSFIATAQGSAPALVQLLVDHCPGFQDRHTYTSDGTSAPTLIHFYKRAQICVGDWNESLQLKLRDMDKLTTFADYRVPQLLRHRNVLVYAKALAALIDDRIEIQKGSDEELAIRACTVTAVELLVDELKQSNTSTNDSTKKWNAVATDWYLWQLGERMENEGAMQPHHRVRTIFY